MSGDGAVKRIFVEKPSGSRVRMEMQFHPDCAWKPSSKTCMKLTSAECTVENS